jgi:hypothetical protein
MLAQPNPVGNRRRAAPLNLSHGPPITDTSSPLRIMDLYEQNVTDSAATWVSEKPHTPNRTGRPSRAASHDRDIDVRRGTLAHGSERLLSRREVMLPGAILS